MLPRVKIAMANGVLGATSASADGLLGLICSAVAVSGKFELNKPYVLTGYDDLATLGITEESNAGIEKLIRDFYAEAGAGTRVYIMGVPNTVTLSNMVDYTVLTNARKLIEVSNGEVRGIIAKYIPAEGYTPTVTDGLDADVYAAITKAQELAEWAATSKFSPVFVTLEGRSYSGDSTELEDLTTRTDNRVSVLIGDTAKNTNGAAMGLLAGRIAASPVQRNIGRVKDGAVGADEIYIANIAAEQADVEGIHDKGFITFRTFVGRSGYFFTNDPMATLPTDDYARLAYRRTIDKAYRIAYITLTNELLDEVPLLTDGTIMPAFAKSWEQLVINAISSQMTAQGELSVDPSDPNDQGVECFIDPAQNVASTRRINVTVRVRPYGYADYIDVLLGFNITTA